MLLNFYPSENCHLTHRFDICLKFCVFETGVKFGFQFVLIYFKDSYLFTLLLHVRKIMYCAMQCSELRLDITFTYNKTYMQTAQ